MKTLELPFNEAVKAAAEQNWERDLKLDLVEEREKSSEFPLYLEEATYLLVTTGENWLPEQKNIPHIVVKK